jgi:hypothetical protein
MLDIEVLSGSSGPTVALRSNSNLQVLIKFDCYHAAILMIQFRRMQFLSVKVAATKRHVSRNHTNN